MNFQRQLLLWFSFVVPFPVLAQNPGEVSSPFDPTMWGVVMEHPGMNKVSRSTVLYNDKLAIDIYSPPGFKKGELLPAIIFLNAAGDRPGRKKIKDSEIYRTWPRLVAVHGFIGISMESDPADIQGSLKQLFLYLEQKGTLHNIDASRLGVYAASANVGQSVTYLMSDHAVKGIKAAVLYYGSPPQGPFKKDLPVLFVVAEGDVSGTAYSSIWQEVLKNKAPWTLLMASEMPHAFDAFSDTEGARRIIRETISFWKNYLEPVPRASWKYSEAREVMALVYGNNFVKAAALLKNWIASHPGDKEAKTTYASVLRNGRMFAEAEIVLKELYAADSMNNEYLMDLATVVSGQQKWNEAESYLLKLINTGVRSGNIFNQLGNIQYQLAKYEEAITTYNKIFELNPAPGNAGSIYFNIAKGYAKLNNTAKAVEALESSLLSGYATIQRVENEKDFSILKNNAEFATFVKKLK